jgi:hypothetical protein
MLNFINLTFHVHGSKKATNLFGTPFLQFGQSHAIRLVDNVGSVLFSLCSLFGDEDPSGRTVPTSAADSNFFTIVTFFVAFLLAANWAVGRLNGVKDCCCFCCVPFCFLPMAAFVASDNLFVVPPMPDEDRPAPLSFVIIHFCGSFGSC